ncbi:MULTISPECIES: lysophospholipid transporter LplT [Tatumella]|uniref:Lysophospholipid transporter LplT n=1 Tax=Tatumella punctata TaxID=399969 RepID=A0ABW1VR57_9GAMM|nr:MULTISPECIES: lysophospholipid transporter LplT [unclassified Tatumella]MBS0855925.1 lysophospholipid transporter LplT [Tatumella sp. JGM16]MBS0876951.1 lysophospholipid transporter LplT [Tatumella sp. JGM82]MBS0890913.1 lysophospholipid transporter LplT [Tatumella sp. JGM94]MBS0901843.1 lysophospholipid transporter LplT [Tatumella sp. JGM100]MBS0912779.1 lysophospholipid transporter LplT [Tatumella sp. JGM91]
MNELSSGTAAGRASGLRPVLLAQFFSAFGDNALLFATLALMKKDSYADWTQPVLQIVFVVAYILLAPFVGQLADSFPKGRVMMVANGLKFTGAVLIGLGVNPFAGYGLVGIGAAAYSPAKYGILGELIDKQQLIRANGLMESSTIVAILLGSVTGGLLADWHISTALLLCAVIYALAVVANMLIPGLRAATPDKNWRWRQLLSRFRHDAVSLWQDSDTRFSLTGTSLFWGAGVTLRFLLVLWVPVVLGITDNKTATLLNGMVAVGIVGGALLAEQLISLQHTQRCIPAGILVGGLVIMFTLSTHEYSGGFWLLLLGVCGGLFVVPLNALLQVRGRESVGAGPAIAVQNFGENIAMLLLLALYTLTIRLGASVIVTGMAFGGLFSLAIAGLWLWQWRGKSAVRQ